ncbi:LysM peptidoglycan-binding domain-containing protein [Alkalibacterium kapii]|uniref:Peptidase M23 n=1 Tax=Alkalibacterium kapii TaxID=426704 RepID=A0A511AV23_9LACT|nr:LysM peptidoglycan-binding domain-containing protein [Alkalibacterium kapii]GEK90951.1 peptidase M23 [Alkalibacterium kapii]
MSKNDRQSMEELWSKRFDEESEFNEGEPLSRKAKREREKSISPILTVTLIFLALLIILPTSAYVWWSSRDSLAEEPTSPSVEQVAENNQEETDTLEESKEEKTSNESESEKAMDENQDGASISEEAPKEESVDAAPETEETGEDQTATDPEEKQQVPATSTDTSETTEAEEPTADEGESSAAAQNAAYYTVKAGDNMYRIALNHGMTTEELMQLNGLQDETVYVGQQLQVN